MHAKEPKTITILGAGSIGISFAAVFLDAGATVTLVEPDAERRAGIAAGITKQTEAIETARLKTGSNGTLLVVARFSEAPATVDMVLECGPEDLDIKRRIFAGLLSETEDGTILATASSAIPMSRIVPDRDAQRWCLVAHPVNPPAVLRLIELVPAPGTSSSAAETAAAVFADTGFTPVTLGAEVEGFALNRLQGAVLREAYRLVDEGVLGANEIDTVMRLGLGPRWALSGPFETAELNTPGGITAHADRMGPAYKRMGEARGETVDWSSELIGKVAADRRQVLPQDQIPLRAAWRVGAVAQLVAARDRIARDTDD
ncbi:MAG: 3-hydroxyacyl-CoA dehydrogenase NAD-binding domain-containing protein [Pseudomonadota bacterium]